MDSMISFGDARSDGTKVTIAVIGLLDIDTMQRFEDLLRPYLHPPGITLDCKELVIRGHGINRLMSIQQSAPRCHLQLIHVAPHHKMAFQCRGADLVGLEVQYDEDTEVA